MRDMFEKKRADVRKRKLEHDYDTEQCIDYREDAVSWSRYINTEGLAFAYSDNERSIASVVDGFKEGQRKVMFTVMHDDITTRIQVSALCGRVQTFTHYTHGETSLQATVAYMAQNFWGTNNINMLEPDGQFGSRNNGREGHGAARYIHTMLNPIVSALFPKPDRDLCERKTNDGNVIEPRWPRA
jgi:DNA topoisomerase-2